MKLNGRKIVFTIHRHERYFILSIVCWIVAAILIGYLVTGCAGGAVRPERIPLQEPVTFELEAVTVVCAGEDTIKRAWAADGGAVTVDLKSVYAFARRDGNIIYIPCVQIRDLVLPESMWVMGHEFWHIVNFKYLNAMNPDWEGAK